MTNELVTQTVNELAVIPEGSWGAEEVTAQDIVISKVLLQQAMSQFVIAGDRKAGDIVDSMTGELLGDKNNPLEVIPLKMTKTWVIERQNGGKFDYVRQDVVDASNCNLNPMEPFFEEHDGKQCTMRRNLAMNYYVIPAAKALLADTIPMVVMFRRTSLLAGKKIATHFTKMQMLRKPPAASTIKLMVKQVTNDFGTFWVWDVLTAGRPTTAEELSQAFKWFTTLNAKSNLVKVDESDIVSEEKPSPSTGNIAF